ncbi:helix-turn-helix domain-containing protein [Paenibacillus sp. USHLN196]|uniref:helix-turn-helix domain-containing protein n=1 Tax=Paenibacillus sp. USHLN196 TaxID=3081291 RepID=UPI00301731DC
MLIVKPQLNKILTERGYTQNSFSKEFDIPQTLVNRFDKSVQHKSENLFIIARALNLKIDDLFEVTEIDDPASF